jgi:hypothetical protein
MRTKSRLWNRRRAANPQRLSKPVEIDGHEWLDAEDPLTDPDKALIESRIEAHDKNPETAIRWQQFDAQLKRRLPR